MKSRHTPNGMELISKGVIKAADIIASTMGHNGKKVFLPANPEQGMPRDVFSRDGVTVGRHIQGIFTAEDHELYPYLNFGAKVLVQAADATVKKAGDGTTTTAVMAAGMLKAFLKSVDTSTGNSIVKALKEASEKVLAAIDEISSPVLDIEEFRNLVTISANNNRELGTLIADLVWEIGPDAYIKADDLTPVEKPKAEVRNGYLMDTGALIKHYLWGKNRLDLTRPYIAIVEEKLDNEKQLIPLLDTWQNMCKKEGGFLPLMIIAGDIESTAQAFLVQNIQKQKLPVVVVKSPLAGNQRYDVLEDIAAATGAKIFSKIDGKLSGYGKRQGKVPESSFGRAESVEVTMGSTRIMTMEDREKAIKAHVEKLRELEDNTHNQMRISKLTNGMGIIYIGGYTNVEARYNDQVIDDAVHAAQSAMRHGIVPGGGYAFIQAFNRAIGGAVNRMEVVLHAGMYAPLNQLLENSGLTYKEYIDYAGADSVDLGTHVLNLETMDFEPISTTSILDSAGVAKQCIINSISLVGEIVDTKYAII